MLRSELVQKIQEKYKSLSINDIEKILDLFLKKILKGLKDNQNIELRRFGTLAKKINKAKKVRNPRTNETLYKNDSYKIHFKIGKNLHNRINKNHS